MVQLSCVFAFFLAALAVPSQGERPRPPGVEFLEATPVVMKWDFCEVRPDLPGEWDQIAEELVSAFNVRNPSVESLRQRAEKFDPGDTFFFYYSVPPSSYGLAGIVKNHFYFVTHDSVREVEVQLQGALLYWGDGVHRDSHGSLIFPCEFRDIGFVFMSSSPLIIKALPVPSDVIDTFEEERGECRRELTSGQLVQVEGLPSRYLVASYRFSPPEKCDEPCNYLDLNRLSEEGLDFVKHVSICDP